MVSITDKSEVTRIIYDTYEAHQLARDLVNGAQSEILILFSTENACKRQFRVKNDQLVIEAANRGVYVTVVAPINESLKKEAERLEKHNDNIRIRSVKPYSSPFTTVVADKKHVLAIELKDDSKEKVEDAIGQAIYSTNRRTVEDAIFKFDIVLRLFQDEDESIKKWLVEVLKIVDEDKHRMN
jgi:two-component system, OmpR family, sensor histidine kinase VicK